MSCNMRGLRVTIPVPRGRILLPTKLSITELLPELWDPTITICGSWMASAPTVLKTSWSLLITGMRDSMGMEVMRSSSSLLNDNSENWAQLINGKLESSSTVVRSCAPYSVCTARPYTGASCCTECTKLWWTSWMMWNISWWKQVRLDSWLWSNNLVASTDLYIWVLHEGTF